MAPSTAAETSKPKQRSDLLRFSTHRHLRQRILLSVLSGKSLRIDNIRSDDVHVGLRDYEVNLLRLVEKVTNGSTIEISVTGMSPLTNCCMQEKQDEKEADGQVHRSCSILDYYLVDDSHIHAIMDVVLDITLRC